MDSKELILEKLIGIAERYEKESKGLYEWERSYLLQAKQLLHNWISIEKCPECGKELKHRGNMLSCSSNECGFYKVLTEMPN